MMSSLFLSQLRDGPLEIMHTLPLGVCKHATQIMAKRLTTKQKLDLAALLVEGGLFVGFSRKLQVILLIGYIN